MSPGGLLLVAALIRAGAGQDAPPIRTTDAGQDTGAAGRWEVLEGRRLTVHYTGGDSLRALRTLRFLDQQPALPGLPPGVPSGVSLFVAPDEAAFDSLTGGRAPEWGVAVAIPSLGRIVVPGYAGDRTRGWDEPAVLRHEWAHLAVAQALEGIRAPRWFDEGYADWASGGWDALEGWRLRVALALGRAPPLDSLDLRWPADRGRAQLAYLLSATAVEYLVRESGVRGLEVLFERIPEAGGFEAAFRATYGVTTGQFEEDWKRFVRERYGWLLVLSHSLVFWMLLGLALVGMLFIRRRRNREAMARLRAGEGPDRPAWWEAEEDPEEPPPDRVP